jgi:hypothetical protein
VCCDCIEAHSKSASRRTRNVNKKNWKFQEIDSPFFSSFVVWLIKMAFNWNIKHVLQLLLFGIPVNIFLRPNIVCAVRAQLEPSAERFKRKIFRENFTYLNIYSNRGVKSNMLCFFITAHTKFFSWNSVFEMVRCMQREETPDPEARESSHKRIEVVIEFREVASSRYGQLIGQTMIYWKCWKGSKLTDNYRPHLRTTASNELFTRRVAILC